MVVRPHVAHVKELLIVLLQKERLDSKVAGEAQSQWPPDHCLIDEDAPGENDVTQEEGVCCSLESHIVVILAE